MQAVSNLANLIGKIRTTNGCRVAAPSGYPSLPVAYSLSDDLLQYFSTCGAIELFTDADYPLSIASPSTFTSANIEIVGEVIENDITASWFVCARGRTGEYITIDLNPARLGWCYDSYEDRHGVAGSCPIIARSFAEFLERAFSTRGGRHYWLLDSFQSYGDAYS
jgi:hypothetical protein